MSKIRTYIILFATAVAAVASGMAYAQNPTGSSKPNPSIEYLKGYDMRSNWTVGGGAGLSTPLKGSFFGDMRPTFGLFGHKLFTPAFGLGAEGNVSFNSYDLYNLGAQRSAAGIDYSYLGVYGSYDLPTSISGYNPHRMIGIAPSLGVGWLRSYRPGGGRSSVAAKAGVNMNFRLSDHLHLTVAPQVIWEVSHGSASTGLNANNAIFNLNAALGYELSPRFRTELAYTPRFVSGLNSEINDLRTRLNKDEKRQVQVQKEVRDNLNATRYIFFRNGSSEITEDQKPNLEMIAGYMKAHPESTLSITGYASADGKADNNARLARARAEAVKSDLVKNYSIRGERIKCNGSGVGNLFDEPEWNRVSVCTLSKAN